MYSIMPPLPSKTIKPVELSCLCLMVVHEEEWCTWNLESTLRVQVPNNQILTKNLYQDQYYQNPKHPIIGHMDPYGKQAWQHASLKALVCLAPFATGGLSCAPLFQDPPCTLNWGYVVPNSRYLGPNRG